MALFRSKKFKICVAVFFGLLVLACIAAPSVLAHYIKAELIKVIDTRLGASTSIERVELDVFSGQYTIKNLHIKNGQIDNIQLHELVVPAITMHATLRGLLSETAQIDALIIENMDLSLSLTESSTKPKRTKQNVSAQKSPDLTSNSPALFFIKAVDVTGLLKINSIPSLPKLNKVIQFDKIHLEELSDQAVENGLLEIALHDDSGSLASTIKHHGINSKEVSGSLIAKLDMLALNPFLALYYPGYIQRGELNCEIKGAYAKELMVDGFITVDDLVFVEQGQEQHLKRLNLQLATTEYSSITEQQVVGMLQLDATDLALANTVLGKYAKTQFNSGTLYLTSALSWKKAELFADTTIKVENIDMRESSSGQKLFSSEQLQLDIVTNLADRTTVHVKDMSLERPILFVNRSKDGRVNLQDILVRKQSEAGAASTTTTPAEVAVLPPVDDKSTEFKLDRFSIQNGIIRFQDDFVLPGKSLFKVRELAVLCERQGLVDNVDSYHLNVTGSTAGKQRNGQIDIDLSRFSPYTEHYNNLKLRKGRAIILSELFCKHNRLKSEAEFLLSQIKVKAKRGGVTGELFNVSASSLLFFLQDSNSIIKFDAAITGTLSEPDIDITTGLTTMLTSGVDKMLEEVVSFANSKKLKNADKLLTIILSELDDKILDKVNNILPIKNILPIGKAKNSDDDKEADESKDKQNADDSAASKKKKKKDKRKKVIKDIFETIKKIIPKGDD